MINEIQCSVEAKWISIKRAKRSV